MATELMLLEIDEGHKELLPRPAPHHEYELKNISWLYVVLFLRLRNSGSLQAI